QPNNVADTIPVNDFKSASFISDQNALAMPFHEGFDSTHFPSGSWLIDNPDNDTTWRRSASHFAGTGSAFIDNYDYRNIGRQDAMISPAIDLSTVSNPVLTFQVAYRLYTDPASSVTGSDTLLIEVSTDCGTSWHQIFKKFGTPLTTVTPPFSHTAFVPTASQWRWESIDLSTYKSAHSALFRFVNITDYENNLYLDEINVMNSNGIEGHDANRLALELFPNPVSDRLQVDCVLPSSQPVSVNMYDMHGKQVALLLNDDNHVSGKFSKSFDLKSYPAGVYLLQVQTGTHSETKRFVIAH
ncbi:MAG TPA: T9SS type A sorting domain-containing protein, partial [Bacteroidia bacterium]|nr:T9SS type A sorting domain-containing protein [Bacteroidia bacterium]